MKVRVAPEREGVAGVPPVGVVQVGLGPIGQGIVRRVLGMEGVRLVAAVDPAPDKVGRDAGELAGVASAGTTIQAGFEPSVAAGASVALHSTGSHLEAVLDQLLALVEAGLNVISTCEELAWPWYHHPEQASILDQAARRAGVTVLGTGVNPGFIMDLFPLVLTGACTRVEHVLVERAVDASLRRGPLQRKIGSGLSPDAFRQAVDEGRMGHVGLPESAALLAAGLGWIPDRIEQRIEPLIAHERVETEHVRVLPGQVLGLHQVVRALVAGRERIRLDLRMALVLPQEAPLPGLAGGYDHVRIEGTPPLEVVVPGGVFGDTATVAAVTNAIPRVLEAPAGLLSVKDLGAVGWYA